VASNRQVAVLDIDGVLADVRHRLVHVNRRPKDWDAFFAAAPSDPLLPEGLAVALELSDEHDVVYLTGRPERCRDDTQHWLDTYGFPAGRLIMRSDTDRRPARFTKIDELRRLRRDADVTVLVDDDERVVQAAESAGFNVLHATWMPDEDQAQQTLFTAQETDGRT
jgi:phosphoglycolate phosphatase-like HAD superfamily hydrolase